MPLARFLNDICNQRKTGRIIREANAYCLNEIAGPKRLLAASPSLWKNKVANGSHEKE